MSETTNYGLFVSNDDQMTFRDWRLKLSGETDSNMTKIDEILSEKPGKVLRNNAETFNDYKNNVATGSYSHTEGSGTTASGDYSHAEGCSTTASTVHTHAEGYNSKASGYAAHAEGDYTTASGVASHAEGSWTKASGGYSHAEGSNTKADGAFSHAEGNATEAVNDNSHAQGLSTKATGRSTDVIGEFNKYEDVIEKIQNTRYFDSSGVVRWVYVFSESDYTISDDKLNFIVSNSVSTKLSSLKAGDYYVSSGDGSYTEIKKCNSISSVSYGSSSECSIDYTSYTIASQSKDRGSFAHIVGNGTSEDTRSNAHTLDWEGNAWFAGDVYVKSTSGKNRDNGSLRLVTTEDLAEVAGASGSVVWGSF